MSRLLLVFLLGLLMSLPLVIGTLHAATVPVSFPAERFSPRFLGRSQLVAQRIGLPTRVETESVYQEWFAPVLASKQRAIVAGGVNYVDLLATVEIMAEAWELSSPGRRVSDEGLRNLFCLWSFCIGGPPKSRSNAAKITRSRERIIAGAYFSEERRAEIRRRLKSVFLNAPTLEPKDIDLVTVDVETFIDLR